MDRFCCYWLIVWVDVYGDEKMKPLIFIPTQEEKDIAKKKSEEFIDSVDDLSLPLKAFILQELLESFEETYNIDIRNGVSIKEKNDLMGSEDEL